MRSVGFAILTLALASLSSSDDSSPPIVFGINCQCVFFYSRSGLPLTRLMRRYFRSRPQSCSCDPDDFFFHVSNDRKTIDVENQHLGVRVTVALGRDGDGDIDLEGDFGSTEELDSKKFESLYVIKDGKVLTLRHVHFCSSPAMLFSSSSSPTSDDGDCQKKCSKSNAFVRPFSLGVLSVGIITTLISILAIVYFMRFTMPRLNREYVSMVDSIVYSRFEQRENMELKRLLKRNKERSIEVSKKQLIDMSNPFELDI
ncbi:hypothetical protein QR680_007361 [Steinernema hermaphroditum]|uniref:Uncharacterized protein n=1 Tax=Steinernema hermaphroditum TaxID=289476 RepID=A0AA39IEJ6_9BILA|nr:hypothetical protein QR680_007361 [Steinernema hermaphroditum]